MTLIESDLNSLKSLPCFTSIVEIFLLPNGMSHTCVKVSTSEQEYLAKKLNQDTATTEIYTALICSNSGLSPCVSYHDNDWLVTEFITGTSLAKPELNSCEQISTALTLMATLHQLPTPEYDLSIPTLDCTKSVNGLFTNPTSFNAQVRHRLASITDILSCFINDHIAHCEVSNVVCHGDLNFTNVLIDTVDKAWLIDFECAHLAPVEYDLAMFIAVNNISVHHISEITSNYILLAPSYRPNSQLLTYYILYSYFINGLWYLDNISDSNVDNSLQKRAIEQWTAFDSFAINQSLALPKLLPIIN
ncbi:phosphotransferase [Colwellia sp. 12G3]|uniref:phosphotransferase n=1 Tax=Colwellia sp. 12G3 TaxID=2058299 RepID=UPI000C3367CF|nr:phosphotransferase [Colwellia sp. 12G3]PKI16328.1 hypothetical protein CXF71_08925 [Colwellia sp. 12G3]